MDDEPEVIRQQMEATRTDLTHKIEALEHQVVGTVQDTTQAVSQTVESVKEAVQETVSTVKDTVSDTVGTVKESVADTVNSVKEALDLRACVQQYPWASFGAAVATGFVGGLLLEGGRQPSHRIAELHSRGEAAYERGQTRVNGHRQWQEDYAPTAQANFASRPFSTRSSWLIQLTQRFAPELDKLKGLAVGALGALVRDVVGQAAAGPLSDRLSDVIDDVTSKLGGEPIRGSLLQTDNATAAGKSSRDRDTTTEGRPAAAQAW